MGTSMGSPPDRVRVRRIGTAATTSRMAWPEIPESVLSSVGTSALSSPLHGKQGSGSGDSADRPAPSPENNLASVDPEGHTATGVPVLWTETGANRPWHSAPVKH